MVGELALNTSAFEPACQPLNSLRWTSSSLSGVHTLESFLELEIACGLLCLGVVSAFDNLIVQGLNFNMPPRKAISRKRKERSPIVEFPPDDAEAEIDKTIGTFLQAGDEVECARAEVGSSSSTAIEVFRPQTSLVPSRIV
ncbi:hypothetical protein R1sor_008572 [Riccia sorocarpa]|uniref:Uncharacterized protein n=1 Tax=Riccia sorocarpa TaxID=122646 RepID=A0ABD3HVH4_9MARC